MAKRGRKPTLKRKGYFYETEEDAIRNYIISENKDEKNIIYETTLRPAFDKMINSIIRRYHLYVPNEEYEETFEDTLSYLLTKINNFNPDKGCKAYSYCGTIAKNYLLQKNIQYVKKSQKNISYEETVTDFELSYLIPQVDNSFKAAAPDLITDTTREIELMLKNPEKNNLNENEVKVGIALKELLSNWEEILLDGESNKMNKSSVLYFLKEETMMDTKELRDNMKKYKKVYKILRNAALS